MIDISKTRVSGFEAAIRGMRNPLESWGRSDSKDEVWYDEKSGNEYDYHVGENDLALMRKLAAAGDDHGKFARFIHVSADILAPRYWWAEYDTYKVGTVANSCSTMHCIHKKEFTFDDFSHDRLGEIETPNHMNIDFSYTLKSTIFDLNAARTLYLETGDKDYWYAMIQLLPQSYNQLRTVDLNYQVLWKMYKARKDHKLDEWHTFCDWVKSLPYLCEIYGI